MFPCVLVFLTIRLPAGAQTTAAWTWMGGSNTVPVIAGGQQGVYGTLGTAAAGNIPASRWDAVSWTDSSGNFWLFGGSGYAAATNDLGVLLNDFWEYNPTTNEWTWMGGSSNPGAQSAGVYGTLGAPAAANIPGCRSGAVSWTGSDGKLWLFGGVGCDATRNFGYLNDLWQYDPATNEWTWIGGTNVVGIHDGQPGVYGTLGTPAPGNFPGGRSNPSSWTDNSGNFWLFGGTGFDSRGDLGTLNDLWEFKPSTGEWAWMSGSRTTNGTSPGINGWPGVYGTLGTPAAGNIPGSRISASTWADGSGNLWLFGGGGFDANDTLTTLNDLWEFNPSTSEWAWMAGSTASAGCTTYQRGLIICAGQPGVYGMPATPAAGNIPGGRTSTASWIDASGNLWLFGGQGYDFAGNNGQLNDLWMFSPTTSEWAWMSGNTTMSGCGLTPEGNLICTGQPGEYGTLGTADPGNNPGARLGPSSWTDKQGNFWLFGGDGSDSAGTIGVLNDVWEYRQSITAPPATAAPTFSPAPGITSSTQATSVSVTIADATPGAIIYYTINGAAPTTSSTVYSGPITVSSSGILTIQTIEALAIAAGDSPSTLASATYTIKLLPTFAVSASPASMTVTAGESAATTVTVTPANGFNSTVSFSCSGLPSGASCSFSPATVTPPLAPASTALTITTTASSAALRRSSGPLIPAVAVGLGLCCLGLRRRRLQQIFLAAVCIAALTLITSCGSSPPQSNTSTLTITATSGSIQQTTTFTLTVN